jgi:hypothetical protein
LELRRTSIARDQVAQSQRACPTCMNIRASMANSVREGAICAPKATHGANIPSTDDFTTQTQAELH